MMSESAAETGFAAMESAASLDFTPDRANADAARNYSETTRRYVELAATENRLRSFRYLLPWCADQPILDLGCAKGAYLRHFAAGSLGIDVSRPNLEHCQSLGLPAVDVDLNCELPIPTASFPAVFCSHVLEHVDAPIQLLRECHRVLTPGGRLILGLPIETSLVNWLRGQRYFYHHPGHLYSFSIENIDVLLRKTGFVVERFYFEPRILRLQMWLALMQRFSPRVAYPLALAYWVVASKKSFKSNVEGRSSFRPQEPIAE